MRRCPHVQELSAGPFGVVATYLPGRRIPGVVIRADRSGAPVVEVHVVARYGPPVPEVAAEVRAAVAGVAGPRRSVTVVVDDLAVPGRDAGHSTGTTGATAGRRPPPAADRSP